MPQALSGRKPKYPVLKTKSVIPNKVLKGYHKAAVEASELIDFAVSEFYFQPITILVLQNT